MKLKVLFRSFYALILVLISLMLIWTCIIKTVELLNTYNVKAKTTTLSSQPQIEYFLLSNNQKPDEKLFIVIPNQGYVTEVNCTHYLTTLCLDQDNQHQFRRVDAVTLQSYNSLNYIENITFTNTQNMQQSTLKFTAQDIQSFYKNDLAEWRNQIITLSLFAIFALYVCFRILKNFRQFLNK